MNHPKEREDNFPIAAVYKSTPSGPIGPFVIPGEYKVRLTVDGESVEKTLTIRMDPRVEILEEDLQIQSDLSHVCYDAYHELQEIRDAIDAMDKPSKKLLALRGNGAPGDPGYDVWQHSGDCS